MFIAPLDNPAIDSKQMATSGWVPIPVKAYLHKTGFTEAFGGRMTEAHEHLTSLVAGNASSLFHQHPRKFDYSIVVLWGETETGIKVADFFGYADSRYEQGTNAWQTSNPDKRTYAIRWADGGANACAIVCEDSDILLGRIAEYRRTTTGLEHFLESVQTEVEFPGLFNTS